MVKKISIAIIVLGVILISSYFLPTQKITWLNILGVEEIQKYAALEVYSLGGDMKVYVDGIEQGVARESTGKFELSPIEEGIHTVRFERLASSQSFYQKFEKDIEFIDGFTVVISWELGPTSEASSGWILTARKNESHKGLTRLSISSDNNDVEITFDNETLYTDIEEKELQLDNQIEIKATKDRYQPLMLELFPHEIESRQKMENYDLDLFINLFLIPVDDAS